MTTKPEDTDVYQDGISQGSDGGEKTIGIKVWYTDANEARDGYWNNKQTRRGHIRDGYRARERSRRAGKHGV
jgi:hypothetical protein